MTVKRFCNGCGNEIAGYRVWGNGQMDRFVTTVKAEHAKLRVEVTYGEGWEWNSGDWCRFCILDAIYKFDPRLSGPIPNGTKITGEEDRIRFEAHVLKEDSFWNNSLKMEIKDGKLQYSFEPMQNSWRMWRAAQGLEA